MPTLVCSRGASTPVTSEPPLRILVVEDDPPLLALAKAILKRAGYEVVAASSAEQARTQVPDLTTIDALFSDVVLPQASGMDLAEELTRDRPDLPVLLTTGQTDTSRHQEIRATGHQLLLKPYSPEHLCDALRAVLPGGSGIVARAGDRP